MSMGFWRGRGCLLFVATIGNPAAPTVAEITAGVDISMGVNAVNGFISQVNRISVPILGSAVDAQVNGAAQFADSGFDLVEDDGVGSNTDDVKRRTAITTLAPNTTGYMVFSRWKLKAAINATSKVDVFAGYVAASNKNWSMGADVAKRTVSWIPTADPQQDVAVAA